VNRGARNNEHDNRPVVARSAALRAERAALLGYPEPCRLSCWKTRPPAHVDAVNDMVSRLAPARAGQRAPARPPTSQELNRCAGRRLRTQALGLGFLLRAGEAGPLRARRALLKPYFGDGTGAHNGVFYAAKQVYGLTFKPRPDLPLYHPDARAWEVFEEDGTPLGIFIGDFYARDSKRGGAWMNAYVPQSGLKGNEAGGGQPPERAQAAGRRSRR
jgi:peptidyl-dipeptidase Dcp